MNQARSPVSPSAASFSSLSLQRTSISHSNIFKSRVSAGVGGSRSPSGRPTSPVMRESCCLVTEGQPRSRHHCPLGSSPGPHHFLPFRGTSPLHHSGHGESTAPKHSPPGHRAWSRDGSAGILPGRFLMRARGDAPSAGALASLLGRGLCRTRSRSQGGAGTWGAGRRVSPGAQLPGSPD